MELARHYFEAFNAQGQNGTQHLRHPDIEVSDPPNFPEVVREHIKAYRRQDAQGVG